MRPSRFFPVAWIGCLVLAGLGPGRAAVVLNEILYHPPGDRDEYQFVELHNAGADAVRLAGWRLARGVTADLPDVVLPPGSLAVVCRDPASFREHYGTNAWVLGSFSGRLKHGGERVELLAPGGRVADAVTFGDRPPWPLGADGLGGTLERRNPGEPGEDPGNWGCSTLPATRVAAGSPGRTNSNYSPRPTPRISNVQFGASQPGMPLDVHAEVRSIQPVREVRLLWRALTNDSRVPEAVIPMERESGEGDRAVFGARIPAQASGTLLRFRIEATGADGAVRTDPDPQDIRPTFSAFVLTNTNRSAISEARLLTLAGRERPGSSLRARPQPGRGEPVRGQAAFVLVPAGGGPVQTFDHIRLTPRQDGWKVRMNKDATWNQISTLNVVLEGKPRWLLSEYLGYELFRRAGVPAPQSGHLRTWVNGAPTGLGLYVEQINGSFLKRVRRDPDGNLYKILWYEQGLEGQHEKKNNPRSGHADLREVVQGLKSNRDEAQWTFIQKQFAVEECASYFAVNQCIQNWDGYFNNYFTYHAPGRDGRWEMFPWDLDKTWGDYDGASPEYDWYGMPLTFGMDGAKEPARWFAPKKHPWGSVEWWRPGGWFSGPMLANPGFRAAFLRRLQELCETEFTEARFGPVIAALESSLEPEIRWQAAVQGRNVSRAVNEFHGDIRSFRNQLTHRREAILQALEKEGPRPR